MVNRKGKVRWCQVLAIVLGFLLINSGALQLAAVPAYAAGVDVLYEGPVDLVAGATFNVNVLGTDYTIEATTPLGALQVAAEAAGFDYQLTDKNFGASGALLLDDVGKYARKAPGYWYAYVNGVYKDGFNNAPDALNLMTVAAGDKIEFYYAAGVADETDFEAVKAIATAAVKTVVGTGAVEADQKPDPDVGTVKDSADWVLELVGAKKLTVSKQEFEDGLACRPSHRVTWTDEEGNEWGGMPLWLLVAMVDDDPDTGPDHYNFNDQLATQGYAVDVIGGDGWKATLDSADIARNDGYIIANTLNGEPLPQETAAGKGCWPLHLKGSEVFGGRQVGNIVRIELTGLAKAEALEGWTLELEGKVGETITQAYFEKGLVCTGADHYREWTDHEGRIWSGIPLWVLVGAIDDIESRGGHWGFNDQLAQDGYSVRVVAGDGFAKTLASQDVARNDDYIIASKCDGKELTGSAGPLRLVGAGVAKDDGSLGGSAVGNIVRIEIPEFITPPAEPGSWNLTLKGVIRYIMSQAEFEAGLACHQKEWTDADGNVWLGMPLWYLAGWVDDRTPHDFDTNLATAGYTILVKAKDGYTKDFASEDVAWSSDYLIANRVNGKPLTDSWPLRLVGDGVAKDGALGGHSVGSVVEIELTEFQAATPAPEVRIVKYAEDNVTVIAEKTVDYLWMEENLETIGDGKTVYRYEGITNNPDDIWGDTETYPGGYKIENAVKGTRVRDLVELVGGMGAGTEIVLVAKDGWETRLPYSSIYTDPAVQERQGDAILAWYADGQYVPEYKDGIRLFFTPGGDHVYSQRDMRDTLPEGYWHYYGATGILYPSCAGLSVKNVVEIQVFSVPQEDWTLVLDGEAIGGLTYDVSKTYWESGLTCQFGADHKAGYTDEEGQLWEGMPLWLLAGFVDDEDQHSYEAFNTELAEAGYNIVLSAADGYSVTIHSTEIIRNRDYIVASLLNGNPIPESSPDWPLKLVGPKVSKSASISNIVEMKLVPATGKPAEGLSDIAGHWAEAKIKQLFELGIVTGRPDGTYRPDDNISRAEFAAILVKALGLEVNGGEVFADTAGHWAREIISTAAGQGLVSGYNDNTFGPDDLVTREQMATMVVRGVELTPVKEPPVFADRADFSDWAQEAIVEAAAAGLISGYPDGSFRPQDNATKAEAATVVANLLK